MGCFPTGGCNTAGEEVEGGVGGGLVAA